MRRRAAAQRAGVNSTLSGAFKAVTLLKLIL